MIEDYKEALIGLLEAVEKKEIAEHTLSVEEVESWATVMMEYEQAIERAKIVLFGEN